jgi:hypothetical protein
MKSVLGPRLVLSVNFLLIQTSEYARRKELVLANGAWVVKGSSVLVLATGVDGPGA